MFPRIRTCTGRAAYRRAFQPPLRHELLTFLPRAFRDRMDIVAAAVGESHDEVEWLLWQCEKMEMAIRWKVVRPVFSRFRHFDDR